MDHSNDNLKPRISAIIPTFKRSPYLEGAIASLCHQDLPADQYEIIVVDNNPVPLVRDLVAKASSEQGREVRFVHEPRLGLHNGRHAGARAAEADVIALIDDDAIADPAWLRRLLEVYDEYQAVCVGGRIVAKWEAEPPAWMKLLPAYMLSILDNGPEIKAVTGSQTIFGCNFSIRKAVLWEVGGFNPECIGDKWMGDGESGLLRKLVAAGHAIHYTPHASVQHIIQPDRVTVKGMRHRHANLGRDSSYVEYRRHQVSRARLLLRAMGFGRLALHQALKTGAFLVLRRDRWPLPWFRESYYRARFLFNLRLALDHRLREFTTRKHYL